MPSNRVGGHYENVSAIPPAKADKQGGAGARKNQAVMNVRGTADVNLTRELEIDTAIERSTSDSSSRNDQLVYGEARISGSAGTVGRQGISTDNLNVRRGYGKFKQEMDEDEAQMVELGKSIKSGKKSGRFSKKCIIVTLILIIVALSLLVVGVVVGIGVATKWTFSFDKQKS